MNKISVTLTEASAMTGLSRATLYRLFEKGKLHPKKQGRRVLLLVDELTAHVNGLPTADTGRAG